MADLGLAGLSSGVDTNNVVAQLMALERSKLTRQTLRQRGFEAQATGLRDIQTKVKALKSAAEAMRSASVWSPTQTLESSNAALIAVSRIGAAPAGAHALQVRQLATAEQEGFTYTKSTSAGQLSIGATNVAIPPDTNAAGLAALINANSELTVSATAIDEDTIVFMGRKTGSAGAFNVTSTQLVADAAWTKGAKDAEYSLDGGANWTPWSSNVVDNAIPGLRLTFKGVTTEPATITVGTLGVDAEGVKGKLKAFVAAYNEVVTATRSRMDEKSVRDPQTTTDAVKGQLFGDSGLSSLLSSMRLMVGDTVAGIADTAMNELAEIGISTGRSTGAVGAESKMGKLILDDAALDAALANPDKVKTLLGAGGVPGFAQKLEGLLDKHAASGGVLDERLKINAAQIDRIKDGMAVAEQRITAKEKRLKAQFAAMEKAMGLAQSQQAWLSGQLSALSK